jgi:hypothetical protein
LCSSPSPLQFCGSGWWELHTPALASTTLAKTLGSSSFSHSSLQAPTACSAMRPSPNFGMTHKILLQQASDSCPQFSLGSEEEQSRWMPCSSSSSCMFLHTVTVNGRSVWWICKGIEFFFKCAIATRLFLACVVKFPWRNGLSYFATCIATRAVFGLHCGEFFGERNWATLECALQQSLFFVLTLSRLLRELCYYWMCIAKWVVSCLGYINYSKKWMKLLLNLYCNKGCLLLVLSKEMFEIYCQAFFSCAILLLLNSSPLHNSLQVPHS